MWSLFYSVPNDLDLLCRPSVQCSILYMYHHSVATSLSRSDKSNALLSFAAVINHGMCCCYVYTVPPLPFRYSLDLVLALLLLGHGLDAFDGKLARMYGQTSKFGEVFDVVIDNFARCVCGRMRLLNRGGGKSVHGANMLWPLR